MLTYNYQINGRLGKINIYSTYYMPKSFVIDLKNDIDLKKNYFKEHFTVYDLLYYSIHEKIWDHFLKTTEDICLIKENEAFQIENTNIISEQIMYLPENWEIFLPFDRFRSMNRSKDCQISFGPYGYFIGTPVYFITRIGAQKLKRLHFVNYPLDEQITYLSIAERIQTFFEETGWFSYDFSQSACLYARKFFLIDHLKTLKAWNKKNKNIALKIVRTLADYCDSLGIDMVLHAGTLIGHVRHGKIMDWDDDVDFAINYKDIDNLITKINEDNILRIIPITFKKTNSIFYKCWIPCQGESKPGYEYLFPFVDLWLFYEDIERGYVIHKEGHRYPIDSCFPFQETIFEGIKVKEPNQPLVILDLQYPGWRDYIKVFSWSHKEKKKLFPSYVIPINTHPKTGRILP